MCGCEQCIPVSFFVFSLLRQLCFWDLRRVGRKISGVPRSYFAALFAVNVSLPSGLFCG